MTAPPLRATRVVPQFDGTADGTVELDFAARLLRRKRLEATCGISFVVDLEKVVSLDQGDALWLEDGRFVVVLAADEPLVLVTGPNLARLAWHIGNRHAPCEIHPHRLVIQREAVMERMLKGLGATIAPFMGPFRPEGGAYGHGRTMGHSHAADEQAHHHADHG